MSSTESIGYSKRLTTMENPFLQHALLGNFFRHPDTPCSVNSADSENTAIHKDDLHLYESAVWSVSDGEEVDAFGLKPFVTSVREAGSPFGGVLEKRNPNLVCWDDERDPHNPPERANLEEDTQHCYHFLDVHSIVSLFRLSNTYEHS